MPTDVLADPARCYRAVESRDARFDGWFIVGVRTTGIYCRPSCPTPVRPKRANVDFYATPAAAQRAGFRACKRCRPDATPGSPAWDLRADLAGRAMRLIGDGVVDREGVAGLARRLCVSERHLNRVLNAEVGAGPLAIARAHRAQTARVLIETTDLKLAEVAFAAGFSSIRQFNDTIREVFAQSPSALRKRGRGAVGPPGTLTVRLPFRPPFAAEELYRWLGYRAIPGVVEVDGSTLWRTLCLPAGTGIVALTPADDHVSCRLYLDEVSDLAVAVERCRRLLDLDADPHVIADDLGSDPVLGPLVSRYAGLRVPGSVDGFETAVFAILGQQVSVRAAVTLAGRIVARHGTPVTAAVDAASIRFTFPRPEDLAGADLDGLGLTGRRAASIRAVALAMIEGLALEPGADRAATRGALLELPGIGPWTADYIALRAVRDPDVLLTGDLVIRRAAERFGLPMEPPELARHGTRWSPWRSYVSHHLWASETSSTTRQRPAQNAHQEA